MNNNNNTAQKNATNLRRIINLPKRKISASNVFILFNISKTSVYGN